ncbi:Ankyrin repeat domain-containing protein 26 [Acipenser ruthenus]|uniref:Ankyrin repeat domain-containing protein 26 n=1 Tax=Acipenser ruthenus TaxID=7906 RepID=A0A444U5U7_ACIRT|nr:Ankyrin repeat domain-containing protein 26 [Acipenser ruthenus]
MKKLFSFGKKKKGFSPNTSDTGSVVSAGYELKEKDLGKLHKAASTGDLSKLKQLAKKHDLSQLDKENRTPLHLACAHGHVDVVHFLTESKAKLNLCDNDNRSPLMKAVQCQQEHCAVTLLEHDADPNLVDINGNTALHLAALIPAISMAIQLLDHDARINATNKEGCTPLILAATENHQEMVEYLLKEGADVDAKDKSKRTSLMIAASNGQISLVRLLLRYDADISIKDDNGWTADDYAVMNGHHACSHLIIEHGTKKRPPQSPHGTSKVKGASVFSSPIRGTESGFAVGGPATDKEEKDGAGDSWPSSDEGEELDFSPKKIQKPSLTKLMNASQKSKNNVNENGNARPQPVEQSEPFISGSEGDSEKERTVCDEPGVLEKATTSRQSSAEQEENESENEEEDEDDEDEEEDEEEEGDEDEDEEDLEDEEEDEEEEASEEDDGGVASLEHENHERTEITVANLCSVVGETVQGQETISRGLDQTAAIGTSVAKGEVSAGEVVAGRDVSVNERGAADEVTGGDQLVADEESSEDQDIEVNEVVHSAVVGHESLSCHNDDGNAESPDRVSALADSWDSEEDNFKDEHPEPKADWQKMEETNDVPVSLIIGHYEGAFDLTTANSWNEMEGKNCKAQVSKIDDQTENIACEENSRNEEEVSQNSDLEIQDIQSGVCSSSVMGLHKHEEDNKESGEESEASVQEMKMEVTDIIEDSGANIMNSGKDSNDKEEVALKPSPSDNEEDSWDTDQEIQNCSEKLVQHKDREGDDFKSCQEKSDLSHGSRKWDEGAYSNTNDVNKSLEKGSNENEGPEIIIWDEDKQHQSVTKQGSNQDRKDAGDDLLDYSCEEKGNLMIHLQQNHSIQDIEKGSESDISWGERSGRPQEPEVFDVNMTSHPEPLQMDQENRVVRTTEKDRSKDFKLLKPAAEMEEYSEEEDEEEEEEEYEDLHISGNILKESGTVDSAVPQNDLDEKGSPEKNLKRDFLSELGLEAAEEDEDSLWDSEEEYSEEEDEEEEEEEYEDLHISGNILKESGTVDSAVPQNDLDEKGSPEKNLKRDLGGNDTEKQKDVLKTPLKIKETVFSNLAVSKETREKQKTDASDWDSASIASRNLPGCKIPLPVHDEISAKLSEPELSTPQRKTPNVVQCAKADQKTSAEKSLSPSNSPPLPKARSLHSLTPPQPQPRSKLLAVKAESREEPTDEELSSEEDDDRENSAHLKKKVKQSFSMCLPMLLKDKECLETPLTVLINTTHDGEDQADNLLGEQNQEGSENQTTVYLSAASSAVPWEERYEKIWVENEKREVKSHYKDVAAELKKKFGEICLKQSSEPSSISMHLRVDLNNEDDSSDEDEIVYQMEKTQSGILQPIPEQKESSLEDSITEPSKPEVKGSKIPDKAVNSNKQAEHPSKEDDNEIQPPVQKRENDIAGYDTDLDSDSEQSAEEKTKCNIDGSGSSVENNTNPDHSKNSKEEDDDNKYQDFVNAGQKNTPLSEDDFELIPTSQPVCAPASKYPSDEELEGDMQRFKNEVGMLKVVFLALEKEKAQLQKENRTVCSAVESLRARLTSALQELERSQSGKVDAERTFQRERDEWLRLQEKHTHETTSLRDSINSLSQQLSKAEAKANSLENECHRATLSHTEKSLMLESMQREREQAQSRLKELEGLLQAEKEQASKSSVRQESMQERMAQAQSENIILRQQLEESQNKGIIKERAVSDVQDRFSDILTNLRADSEGRVQIVEERNKELMAKNIELREQVYGHQNEKAEREAALRQLQQELADALKKLSMSEASLEVNTRYRNDLEAEKIRFQKDIDRLKGKLQETEDQFIQSEHRIHKLKSALDDKEREVIAASQKLQEILSASSGMEKTVKQLDEHIQRLEIENARLEATAKQQTNRIEVLQKEVHGSAAVQNRLEDLVTNLQGAKINLEEQLNQEAQKQSMLSHNAQDSHLLWEEELKSRSKLGLRLAQLEREKVEVTSQMETEKKKTKKIAELKRSTEARLDQEMKRNSELQKEINRMRTLVKTAKKKQKQQETGEFASQLSSIRGELDNRHLETGTTIARLKSKIDELSQQLEKESLQSTRLESTNSDLREQLSSMKALRKSHEKLERSKRQLEEEVSRVRRHIETNMMDHSQIEQCKREAEERARQEIRQKLEEVNLFLQTQAASQEALEQIKATNEATLRNQLEQRIRDLEGELSRARSTQQNSLSQRDSTQTELERYKELYSEEFKLRKSLAAKLDRSNERLAEANTKLLNERQRSKSFIASSIVNGSLTASPVLDVNQLQGSIGNFGGTLGPLHRNLGLGGSFLNPVGDGTSPNSRVDAYIAKMQNELEKNITKELDHATAELDGGSTRMSPVGSAAGSLKTLNLDQDPVTRATQQYLEVLKKNYMI